MIAFKHIQAYKLGMMSPVLPVVRFQRTGEEKCFFNGKGPSRSRDYFHNGYQFLPQGPEHLWYAF